MFMIFNKPIRDSDPETKDAKSQPISGALHAYTDLVFKRAGAPAPGVGGRHGFMLYLCIVLLI